MWPHLIVLLSPPKGNSPLFHRIRAPSGDYSSDVQGPCEFPRVQTTTLIILSNLLVLTEEQTRASPSILYSGPPCSWLDRKARAGIIIHMEKRWWLQSRFKAIKSCQLSLFRSYHTHHIKNVECSHVPHKIYFPEKITDRVLLIQNFKLLALIYNQHPHNP